MYSTSSPQTRVPWAAHSYNVAFDYEIGHFDYCTSVDAATGSCSGLEGVSGDQEPADFDDNFCFTAAQSTLVPVTGCTDSNVGFDGTSYKPDWPDGNTRLHPKPVLFTSPLTGQNFRSQYSQAALETNTPRIEAPDFGGTCDRSTGNGCTLVPITDDGQRADFYPFFSITGRQDGRQGCQWLFGNDVPGLTARDFGGVSQYGSLLPLEYLVFGGHGATLTRFNDYRRIFPGNPCRS
jgi:hypothetical protein